MDISKQLKKELANLEPGEKVKMIGELLDAIHVETNNLSDDTRKVYSIPITSIDPFPDHPFYVENDEDMGALVRSVRKLGIITPGTVRVKDDGRYELLSGHRRLWACKLTGIDRFRCEVLDLTDEEATLYMIEANRQRRRVRPCEKGLIYRLRDSLIDADMEIRNMTIDTEDTPYRIGAYLQFDRLIPEFQERVDEGTMALRPAKELSLLPEEFQKMVLEAMEYEACSPNHDQVIRMRKLFDEGCLTKEAVEKIMAEAKPNQRPKIIIKMESTLALIPEGIPEGKQEDYIAKALDFYEQNRR